MNTIGYVFIISETDLSSRSDCNLELILCLKLLLLPFTLCLSLGNKMKKNRQTFVSVNVCNIPV